MLQVDMFEHVLCGGTMWSLNLADGTKNFMCGLKLEEPVKLLIIWNVCMCMMAWLSCV
jgi:hypothetical protein